MSYAKEERSKMGFYEENTHYFCDDGVDALITVGLLPAVTSFYAGVIVR